MERIEREKRIVSLMISIYCKHKEHHEAMCTECRELEAYAHKRLSHCRHGNNKKACKDCKTHCYAPDYRNRIRTVMRFAGPRMLWYSPLECLRHFFKL